jgi:hypothetical protein
LAIQKARLQVLVKYSQKIESSAWKPSNLSKKSGVSKSSEAIDDKKGKGDKGGKKYEFLRLSKTRNFILIKNNRGGAAASKKKKDDTQEQGKVFITE